MTASAELLRAAAPCRARSLALRRSFGALVLCGGVLVTVSTPAPYSVRTEVPVVLPPAGAAGPTLRVRDVLVILPGPCTRITKNETQEEWPPPWDGAPVVTVINEGTEAVVLLTVRVNVVLRDASYSDPNPGEHSIGPGERRSVSLTLRPDGAPSGPYQWDSDRREWFCFGELLFPDGTVHPIEGEIEGL